MQSGSKTYDAALTYYNTVQEIAKKNTLNAKPIADNLGKRSVKPSKKEKPFPQVKKKKKPSTY